MNSPHKVSQSLTIFFRNILSHKISDRLFQHSFTSSSLQNLIASLQQTQSQNISQQTMKQYFIKLFIEFFITKFRQHFIEYFVTTSSQQFWYRTSSQLHFNKLFNNYSDRSSTNSSYHKLSQYHSRVRRLFITYFHNILHRQQTSI